MRCACIVTSRGWSAYRTARRGSCAPNPRQLYLYHLAPEFNLAGLDHMADLGPQQLGTMKGQHHESRPPVSRVVLHVAFKDAVRVCKRSRIYAPPRTVVVRKWGDFEAMKMARNCSFAGPNGVVVRRVYPTL